MSIAAERLSETAESPSARTIRRALSRDVSKAERKAMSSGYAGWRDAQLYRTFEAEHRNQLWQADHKELSLYVLHQGEVVRPWATIFIDDFSRVIPGALVSPGRPAAEDVLAAVVLAMDASGDQGLGGLPVQLRWDNDTTFLADAVTQYMTTLGVDLVPSDVYKPQQKGKIERFNRTVEQRFSSQQPGWKHGPTQLNDDLYDRADGLLSLEEVQRRFDDFIDTYNSKPHQGIGGAAPLDRWRDDPTEVVEVGPAQLCWALPAEDRTVHKDGLRYNGEKFFARELMSMVGDRVQIRSIPYASRRIEVCRDNKWLCTAVNQRDVTEEDDERFFKERGTETARVNKALRRHAATGPEEDGTETDGQDPTFDEGEAPASAFSDALREDERALALRHSATVIGESS